MRKTSRRHVLWKMATIEDIVKQLGDQAPVLDDPEEDVGDVTAARLAPHHEDAEEVEALTAQSTQLRRRAAAYLESDQRYRGRKTSRKELYESAEEDNDEEDDEKDFEGSESDSDTKDIGDYEEEEDSITGFKDEEEEEKAEEEVDNDESDESGIDDEMDSDGDEEITSESSDSESEGHIIQNEEKDEGEKARAVVEQLDLWDRLMEGRIKLQKTLSLINKIPSGVQLEGSQAQQEAQSVLQDLSCALCGLQSTKSSPRKRKADVDTEQMAKENFSNYQSTRNNTLTFWDDKTRLASKKFKSFNSFNTSVLKQVEQILSDRDRLVRRTRVSRDAEAAEIKSEEIFDDNDFYQRLLRQLIENKSEDTCASSSTKNQWLEIQKLRVTKKKKEVDTRASKGRKLRYNVHSKLVNFMAPRDDSTWSEEAKNELFKNLFKMTIPADR